MQQQRQRRQQQIRNKTTTTSIWNKTLTAICAVVAVFANALVLVSAVPEDDYSVAEGNRSLVVALGCFWCAEQAFEQYAPGVIEAVSGYTGGFNDNPTYRNHPGHYEVVLVEYDPTKTSYEVLVNYAYRNMDPFDGTGQFCDRGNSYYPAIYYQTESEREIAEDVLESILIENDWDSADIPAPILPRPVFWTAEEYHQDYYIKNPLDYGYYKNGCRRPQRLKEVWGTDVYKCYHDEEHTCFVADGDNSNSNNSTVPQILNANGELVDADSNLKMVDPEQVGRLPSWAKWVIGIVVGVLATVLLIVCIRIERGKQLTTTEVV